jgi:hypothetical protein
VKLSLDADHATANDGRVVQLTPHNSDASIIFGKGIASAKAGLADGLVFAVGDLDAARDDLIARGVNVFPLENEAIKKHVAWVKKQK